MKKLLSVALILCLMIPCAFAEDYSAMSNEELLEAYSAIRAEVLIRFSLKGDIFPGGIYIGGQNIEAGATVTGMTTAFTQFRVYASYEDFISGADYIELFNVPSETAFTVVFTEGAVWTISEDLIII